METEQKEKRKDKYFFLSTLARGLKVVELLAEEGELSVSEVAARLGLNRTCSHRYLATLKETGYAQQNEERRYRLTFRIFELGMKIADMFSIRQEALPYMHGLASQYNETVNFACLDGTEIIHIEKVDSKEILRIDLPLGSRAPAYCTALGKAILAFLPQEELDKYLEAVELKPRTSNTITSKEKLKAELERVREQAVAIDNEEFAIGHRCVGAPILDRLGYPQYAISVSGVAMRMPQERVEEIKEGIRSVCAKLSSNLNL
ncbi:MAG: IclR family transcriptional regulator [Anaerolineales bacterium]|nr:MAG: IclR family transcriptional regulator [Anaerolineales bacterium]